MAANAMSRIIYVLCIALLSLGLLPQSSFASGPQAKRDMDTPPPWGICTRVKNAGKMKAAGYSYVEAGVKRFLIPQEPEEAFAAKRAEAAKASPDAETANAGNSPRRGGHGRRFTPERMKNRIETSEPEQRARRVEFFKALRNRAEERGVDFHGRRRSSR